MAGAYEKGEVDSAKTAELFAVRGGAGISLEDYKAGRRGTGGKFPVIGTPGLSLWVRPAKGGFSVSWRLRLSRGGKETTKTERYRAADNGAAGGKTLKEARAWAAEVRAAWADGRDLIRERRLERQEERNSLPDTIGELIPIWAAKYNQRFKYEKQRKILLSIFQNNIGKELISMRPNEVKPKDIAELLTGMALAGRHSLLNLMRQFLEGFFAWCALEEIGKRDEEKVNPAAWYCLKARMPPRKTWGKVKHYANCPAEKLPRLFRLLTERPFFNAVSSMALAFQILTATRIGNVTSNGLDDGDGPNYARWEDIDLTAGLWKIPAARMKVPDNGPHVIPLSRQALAILARLKRMGLGDYEAVFYGPHGGPLTIHAVHARLRAVAAIDEARGGDGFKDENGRRPVPHGVARASFRTWGAEKGFPETALERALHHKKDGLGYDRSDLLEKRREIMQAWADYLFSECPATWADVEG